VRGVGGTAGFAYGTARSAGVSFQDNVAVNCYGGMNVDTRPARNIDLTNSLFLDVSFVAFFGGPGLWTHNGGTWFDYFTNFTVSDNAARLSAVALWQEYKSYDWRTNTIGSYTYIIPVTDPALPLGRFLPGSAWGLRLMGTHLTWFEHNRFTTRPQAQFYEPAPTNLALAVWNPLHRPTVHAVTGQVCYQDGTNVSSGNLYSEVAMDFGGDFGVSLNQETALGGAAHDLAQRLCTRRPAAAGAHGCGSR
jgi:hypothetical protein